MGFGGPAVVWNDHSGPDENWKSADVENAARMAAFCLAMFPDSRRRPVKFRRAGIWGPIAHFKFNVDTTPPRPFNVSVTDNDSAAPKITFESSDELSGIDHYEVRVDEAEWTAIDKALAGNPYAITGLSNGEHEIQIRAVDMAGNTATASTTIRVVSPTVLISGDTLRGIIDAVRGFVQNPLFAALIVAFVALSHEFFSHSKWWRRFKKHLQSHDEDSSTVDLRDIRRKR